MTMSAKAREDQLSLFPFMCMPPQAFPPLFQPCLCSYKVNCTLNMPATLPVVGFFIFKPNYVTLVQTILLYNSMNRKRQFIPFPDAKHLFCFNGSLIWTLKWCDDNCVRRQSRLALHHILPHDVGVFGSLSAAEQPTKCNSAVPVSWRAPGGL